MTVKTPESLTYAGLFLKIVSWIIIVQAMGDLRRHHDAGLTVFIELFGIGLFFVAWKMQNNLREWARLSCWGFSLLVGAYFILDYAFQAAGPHISRPSTWELILGVSFIWLFVYLSQPNIKRLFKLARQ